MANTGYDVDTISPSHVLPLGLAPMEGVTCLPTRLWLGLAGGFDFAITPFLRVTRDYPPRRIPSTFAAESVLWVKTDPKKHATKPRPYELIPQLMGQTVTELAPVAQKLLENVSFVDFNCGCPSPTVVGNGAGSSLLRTPQVFDAYLNDLALAMGADRMSIKMRIGFDCESEFDALLDKAAPFALAQITIHGRTRAQRYKGLAQWHPMAQAANRGLRVVGSGDVLSAQSYLERVKLGHPNKVLIGRGALRNPFVFHEIRRNKPVVISKRLLKLQFKVALILHSLFELKSSDLLQWASLHFPFLTVPADNESFWQDCFDKLYDFAFGALSSEKGDFEFDGLPIPKGSFFKMKMIWNYYRTSLPTVALDASCLRAPDPDSFWDCLDKVTESLPQEFELHHRAEYDWVFSGAGKAAGVGC